MRATGDWRLLPSSDMGCSSHLRDCQLPPGDRTLISVPPLLFMFLSLPLNCSLTKGLINSYAGQLKHTARDRFCSTDIEAVRQAGQERTQPCLLSDPAPNLCMRLNLQSTWNVQTKLRQPAEGGGGRFGDEEPGSSLQPLQEQEQVSIGKVQVSMSAASALAHLCGYLSISTEKPLSGLGQSLSIHFINIYRLSKPNATRNLATCRLCPVVQPRAMQRYITVSNPWAEYFVTPKSKVCFY